MISSRMSTGLLVICILLVWCAIDRPPLGESRPRSGDSKTLALARDFNRSQLLAGGTVLNLRSTAAWFAGQAIDSQKLPQKSILSDVDRTAFRFNAAAPFARSFEADFCRFNPELFKLPSQTAITLMAKVSRKAAEIPFFNTLAAQSFPEFKSSGDDSWGPWDLGAPVMTIKN